MAKKRKLNKKVVVLLGLAGVLLLVVVGTVVVLRQPRDPGVYMQRGAQAAAAGTYDEAAKDYRIAITASRKEVDVNPIPHAEHLVTLGELLLNWLQNDPALTPTRRAEIFHEARSTFMEAVRYDPKSVKALRHVVELEYVIADARKDWVPYLEALEKFIQLQPKDLDLLFQRALGRERAAEANERYLALAAEDFKALVKAAPQKEDYWTGYAEFYRKQKKLAEAEAVYTEALKANPNSYRLRVAYAGMLAGQPADKAKVLPLLTQATELAKNDPTAYLARADYYIRERDMPNAKKDLNEALRIDPSSYRPYLMQARIQVFERDYDAAQKTLDRGLQQVHKKSAKDLQGQELAEHRNGVMGLNHELVQVLLDSVTANRLEPDKVRPRINQALAEMQGVDAENPYVLKVQGQVALLDEKVLDAEKLLRKAYDSLTGLDVKTGQLLINLYYRQQQLGEAQKIVERYVSIVGDDPVALAALLRLYVDYRQYDAAAKVVQTLQKVDPDGEAMVAYAAGLDAVRGKMKPPLRVPQAVKDLCKPPEKVLERQVTSLFAAAAEQMWLEGNHAGAIRLMEDLLECDPGNLGAHVQLVRWLRGEKDMVAYQNAVQRARNTFKGNPAIVHQFELLLETDPDKVLARQLEEAKADPDPIRRGLRLAGIYRQTGNEEGYYKALKEAEAAAKDKLIPEVVGQLFDYALAKQNWAEAGKYADIAIKADLDGVKGKLYQARMARAQATTWGEAKGKADEAKSKWDEAVRLTLDALRERPRFSEVHSFLGDCYLATDKIEQAREEYEQAHEQNPANVAALMGLMRVAEITLKSGQYDHWVKEAYKFVPNHPEIRERYLQLIQSGSDPKKAIRIREERRRVQADDVNNLIQLADLYFKQGQADKAEDIYREIVRKAPAAPAPNQLLANFLRLTNRSAEGMRLLSDWVARVDPKDKITARLVLGQYLEDSGNDEAAKGEYLKAVEADRNDGRGYTALARFASRRQQWDDAVKYQQSFLGRLGDKAPPQAELQLAEMLTEARRLPEAHERLGKILGKSPNDVEAWTLQGKAYLVEKKWSEAKEALDRALRENPTYAAALSLRAEMHLARHDKTAAIADLEKAREAQLVPGVSMRLAAVYAEMNDFTRAQSVLQSLLTERPDYMPAMQQMLQLCRRFQKWDAMERVLAEARKTYPDNPVFLMSEAEMWRARDQFPKAVAALEQARQLAPNNVDIALALLQARLEARQYDEVVRSAEALRTDPQVGPMVTAVAAVANAGLKNPAQAETEFQAALKDAKDERQVVFIVGRIRQAYSLADAAANLAKWRSVRPDDWMLVVALADMYEEKGEHKAAVELLKQTQALAKTNPQKAMMYRHLGVDCQLAGLLEEAAKAYRAAMEIEPNDPITLNNLAWMLAQDLKRPAEALPLAQKAVQLKPDNSDTLDTLGLVLLLKEDLKEAETQLQRSIDAGQTSSNRLHLGMVYEKMKRPAEAQRQYELGWNLVKDNPKGQSHQELRDALKRLESGGRTGK